MVTTVPNIRCIECGEFSVTLKKRGSIGNMEILEAECKSCGFDVKQEIEDLQDGGD